MKQCKAPAIPWPEPEWHSNHIHPSPAGPDNRDCGNAECQCCYVDRRIAAWTVAFARYVPETT